MNNPTEELRQTAYAKAVELENLLLGYLSAVRQIRATLEGKPILNTKGGKKQ